MNWSERLGSFGVWRGVDVTNVELARRIERAGYGTIWLGGSPGSHLLEAERLLDATTSITLATGIVNIWRSNAVELAESYHRISAKHPGRLMIGIGSGHREATPERVRPVDAMTDYLDALDAGGVPVTDRVISALGPRMIAIAAERSAGTHPYLTVPAQSREARLALGPSALVAPEQTVVLDTDEATARHIARNFLRYYLTLENYTNTMKRGGFSGADVGGEGSDRLVDTLVPHGDAEALAAAIRAHLEAGADHVCVQVQPANSDIASALDDIGRALKSPKRRA